MTTFFDTTLAAAAPALVFPVMGESITYTPSGGSPRTITALVDRNPLEELSELGAVLVPAVEIEVLDNATTGIDSATLNVGGDTVTVALWPGKTPVVLPITFRFASQDDGLIRVRCGG